MDKSHWETIYTTRSATEVSWYRTHLEQSLTLIEQTGTDLEAHVIDVGGGASTLADDLLAAGYRHLTILDISSKALATAKARLGRAAAQITWREADITQATLPINHYDIWHDRAVFHFLTQPEDRRRYVAAVQHAVKPGGHIIMACFGPTGPRQCSGLDIVRYRPEQLHGEFGSSFRLMNSISETHLTPAGKEQQFIYCYCKMG